MDEQVCGTWKTNYRGVFCYPATGKFNVMHVEVCILEISTKRKTADEQVLENMKDFKMVKKLVKIHSENFLLRYIYILHQQELRQMSKVIFLNFLLASS